MAARIERGDIRMYQYPGAGKKRPVLVLTRHGTIRHLSKVTIAPITSSVRGVPSEIVLGVDDGMKKRCAVNFYNLVTVGQRNLGRRVGKLGPEKMTEACQALLYALGCDVWSPVGDVADLIGGVTQ